MPSERVKASVNACSVIVESKLEGSIQASDRVDLGESTVVTGDIASQRISIDEGAPTSRKSQHLEGVVQEGSGACGRFLK